MNGEVGNGNLCGGVDTNGLQVLDWISVLSLTQTRSAVCDASLVLALATGSRMLQSLSIPQHLAVERLPETQTLTASDKSPDPVTPALRLSAIEFRHTDNQ